MWLERLQTVPMFFELWLQHQRRDAYWKYGSVCEDYAAIDARSMPLAVDRYKNAIPRLPERLRVPRKGLIGPWAHAYPHFALSGPQIGFLQEMLRRWDYWLKGIDTGVMDEPVCRAELTDGRLVSSVAGMEIACGRRSCCLCGRPPGQNLQHGVLSISWPHP
jgi:uncharacterized protein